MIRFSVAVVVGLVSVAVFVVVVFCRCCIVLLLCTRPA